jgi:hypothetical protein
MPTCWETLLTPIEYHTLKDAHAFARKGNIKITGNKIHLINYSKLIMT